MTRRSTVLTGFLPGENALRVGKKLGLCAENKTAAELVTRAEAAQLLHAVLTQNLTVTPPDTPVTVENLIQWNVNAFLLELRKVPQPILDAFNENGWTFVIGTEYLADLSRKLGVNCIGAAAYTEKRIYVSRPARFCTNSDTFLIAQWVSRRSIMGLVKARLYKTQKLHLTVWPLLICWPATKRRLLPLCIGVSI